MGNLGELSPYDARDAAGFVESMQRLKERSGLTYRQLEERAARSGDVLARSTLADILRRTSLPRADVLAAFVRACGDGHRVDAWLEARERIAAGIAPPATAPAPEPGAPAVAEPEARQPTGASAVPRPRRTTGRTVALATSLMVVPLALVAWALLPDDSGDRGALAAPAAASRTPADGWVTIRPARTPELCLTDGRDRDGAYASAVAVQLPCAQATVPRTYLEPVGEGRYRVQWHHPQEGRGCLTVMSSGPARGMLEPWNDCARATLFLLRPTAAAGSSSGSFLLRPANSSRCIGIADDDTAEGAEATEERCTGAADQRFLVRAG
ncbi:helix-turn-helix domain-containing protein [Streptomyces lushanensis]|uniref:helix-turn-helix domain-containing protein n=1 Tax=Streptomyces lushanensis TaxID=1434255 RepID=UPI000B0DBC3F|nr:helix-turn-helix transcriptional regulator [Streptomyces lushanensis]